MRKNKMNAVSLCFAAVMAAMVYVVTLFRFPLFGSKVHFANAVCLLSGMLLGPVQGGIAAGLGSALYDGLAGGYDFINVIITFVSKFAMAFVCGAIINHGDVRKPHASRTVVAAVCGALTYVCLYMLKTFIYNQFVYGYPMDVVLETMLSKFIPSIINAVVAIVASPIFYHAVLPALRASGLLRQMRTDA